MSRLNKERQGELEPKRIKFAKEKIESKGYTVEQVNDNELKFMKKGNWIYFFPYSGWATGSGIVDGRGLNNLLKQI